MRPTDPVAKALFSQFRQVAVTTPLSELARAFDKDAFAVVTQQQRTFTSGKACRDKTVVVGVVTRIDLLKFISGAPPPPMSPSGAASPARSAAPPLSLAGGGK